FRQALAACHVELAALQQQSGHLTEAMRGYEEACRLDPQSAAARKNLAWLLATCADPKFRDPAKAVELAKKAVDLAPKDGTFWITLGAARYRAGDWKAALTALHKSMELRNGGDSFDWFFLAMAHWQLGAKDEGRKWYEKAVEWMDRNAKDNDELRRFRREA